jgi:hypothetical protein
MFIRSLINHFKKASREQIISVLLGLIIVFVAMLLIYLM